MSDYRLPKIEVKGWTLCSFIESTGTQAINTLAQYTSDVFEIEWRAIDTTTSGNTTLFACTSVSPYSGGLYGTNSSRKYYIGTTGDRQLNYSSNDGLIHSWKLTSDGTDVTLYKDGTQVGQITASGIAKNLDIFLFCGGYSGTSSSSSLTQFAKWKLYGWKFTSNSTLVRNFLPVKNTSTSEYAMYDTVTKTIYHNSGTGSFTGGDIIQQRTYIQGTGTQYIDTGHILTTNTITKIKMSPTTNASSPNNVFWGAYNDSKSGVNNQLYFNNAFKFQSLTPRPIVTGISDNEAVVVDKIYDIQAQAQQNGEMTCFLMARNNNVGGAGYLPARIKLYGASMIEDTTLVRDLVPISVGTVGAMYDLVSNTIYTNAGSGSFTVGSVVPELEAKLFIPKKEIHGKNLFDVSKTSSEVPTKANPLVTKVNSANSSSNLGTIGTLCPSLKVGDVVYLHYETTYSDFDNMRIGISWRWNNDTSITVTDEVLTMDLRCYRKTSGTAVDITLNNFTISKEPYVSYEPYSTVKSFLHARAIKDDFYLPSGYERLEYIQSSGEEYINTGLTSFKNTYTYYYCFNNIGSTSTSFLGLANPDSVANDIGAFISSSTLNVQSGARTRYTFSGVSMNAWHELTIESNKYTLDSNVHTFTAVSEFTQTASLYLFAVPSDARRFVGQMSRHWIKDENGVLLRDLIPARRTSDSALGMYDTVTNTFYGNSGSGTFTAGPKMERVEYLESNGSQYIDTKIVPVGTDDITVVCSTKNPSTTTTTYAYFGCTSGDSPRFTLGTKNGKYFGGWNYDCETGAIDGNYHTLRIFNDGNPEVSFDGNKYGYGPPSTMAPALTSYLFARHGSSGVATTDGAGTKIKSFEWKAFNGTLKMKLLPIKVGSEYALYDTVSNKVFRNAGSSSFTGGNVLPAVTILYYLSEKEV